jgi:hypothetical protein
MSSRVEDDVRAALRAEGERLRAVRPLRLPPDPRPVPRRRPFPSGHRAHWLKAWAAPVTAVAMVIALAICLVIVSDIRNEQGVPALSPALGRYGIPRYYAALYPPEPSGHPVESLVVGDTFTGARVATVAAPRGVQFMGVSGAGNGRIFIVEAAPAPRAPVPYVSDGVHEPVTWYLLQIFPGSGTPARLTPVPVTDMARGNPATFVWGFALSGSGRKLAVALGGSFLHSRGGATVRVYSVATGQAERSWSASSASLTLGLTGLTWVDGDRAVGFTFQEMHLVPGGSGSITTRLLDLRAGGSDLLKDSRVVREPYPRDLSSGLSPVAYCEIPRLTSDASAVVCSWTVATMPKDGRSTVSVEWDAYPAATPSAAHAVGRLRLTLPASAYSAGPWVYWASPSGDTLVSSDATGRIGIVRRGTFSPLPVNGSANLAGSDLAL